MVETVPQGLKPKPFLGMYGMAKELPEKQIPARLRIHLRGTCVRPYTFGAPRSVLRRVFPQAVKPCPFKENRSIIRSLLYPAAAARLHAFHAAQPQAAPAAAIPIPARNAGARGHACRRRPASSCTCSGRAPIPTAYPKARWMPGMLV